MMAAGIRPMPERLERYWEEHRRVGHVGKMIAIPPKWAVSPGALTTWPDDDKLNIVQGIAPLRTRTIASEILLIVGILGGPSSIHFWQAARTWR